MLKLLESKIAHVKKDGDDHCDHDLRKRSIDVFMDEEGLEDKIYLEGDEDECLPKKKKPEESTPQKKKGPVDSCLEDTNDTKQARTQLKGKSKKKRPFERNHSTEPNLLNPFSLNEKDFSYSDVEDQSANKLLFMNLIEKKEGPPSRAEYYWDADLREIEVDSSQAGSNVRSRKKNSIDSKLGANPKSGREAETHSQPTLASKMAEWSKGLFSRPASKAKLTKTGRGNVRGPYNMLDLNQRNEIVEYAAKFGADRAHAKYMITKSRIRRYLNNGTMRKKGGGRKTLDPDMEENLLRWIEDSTIKSRCFPNRGLIKSRAKSFSKVGSFLASKGWCDKFFKRNAQRLESVKKMIEIGSKTEA